MEKIRQAVERAKASASSEEPLRPITASHGPGAPQAPPPSPTQKSKPTVNRAAQAPHFKDVELNWQKLEQQRIVAHNAADPRSKAFDVLRTQVLQSMDKKNWKFLAVTSPTAGCGKTVTAINLALSIARQLERSALLIDMDLPKPTVANYLGIKCQQGVRGILEGRTTLAAAIIRAHIDNCELMVLPTEGPTVHSSELIASRNMGTMLQDIKQIFRSHTVIFDMPPLLLGDEVLATLPRIDGVLLVTAVGVSTVHEIEECNKHLHSTEVIRLVLNKAHAPAAKYYY